MPEDGTMATALHDLACSHSLPACHSLLNANEVPRFLAATLKKMISGLRTLVGKFGREVIHRGTR